MLNYPKEPISHVYFPVDSFISMVLPVESTAGVEVGMAGNEGMFGVTLILGVDATPFRALVQGAGLALRIAAPLFLSELERSAALQAELKRYLYVSLSQISQTAACNRFHTVEARLARWLLMTQETGLTLKHFISRMYSWPICWVYVALASPKRQVLYRAKILSVTNVGKLQF